MLKARGWLIVLLALVGAAAGAIASRQIPKRYEARTRLVVDLFKADPVTGEALPPKTLETLLAAQVELIRDPRVTRRVADQFGWTRSPALHAKYEAARRAGARVSLREWLAADVSRNTRATLIRNSPIIEIVYETTMPETARRGADAVREAFLAEALDSKRRDAAQNAAWFGQQAAELKNRLVQAEQRKTAFERANHIVLQDDNVDAESSRLQALASSASVPMAVMTAPMTAPSAAQLALVDAQLAAARRTLGVNHPEIIALQQQRAALASAVNRELASARAASRPVTGGSTAAFGAQSRKVLEQRGLVDEARRLAGDVAVLRGQVAKTTQRAADFELQAQATEAGFRKLGGAATPRSPVTPQRWLLMLGGLIGGAVIGAIATVLLEVVARRVRGPEDLQIEGLPLIGMLEPVVGRKRRAGSRTLFHPWWGATA
jgi:uncharacterized protein involved in exopolysaccharide biosynthesis